VKQIVFASSNPGKIKELQALLGDGWQVKSAKDFPSIPEVDEDRDTFEGNAAKKAHAFAKATGLWALADDSGLVVDALGGRPGVWSARYAPTESARIDKLLGELAGVPLERRTARFVCALCLASPSGEERFTRGTCEGAIGYERKGAHGFGYDPVFVLPSGKTMSELSREEKSALSHRGHAFRAMLPALLNLSSAS
jgi:XTP/dITP diphosphohydrolase